MMAAVKNFILLSHFLIVNAAELLAAPISNDAYLLDNRAVSPQPTPLDHGSYGNLPSQKANSVRKSTASHTLFTPAWQNSAISQLQHSPEEGLKPSYQKYSRPNSFTLTKHKALTPISNPNSHHRAGRSTFWKVVTGIWPTNYRTHHHSITRHRRQDLQNRLLAAKLTDVSPENYQGSSKEQNFRYPFSNKFWTDNIRPLATRENLKSLRSTTMLRNSPDRFLDLESYATNGRGDVDDTFVGKRQNYRLQPPPGEKQARLTPNEQFYSNDDNLLLPVNSTRFAYFSHASTTSNQRHASMEHMVPLHLKLLTAEDSKSLKLTSLIRILKLMGLKRKLHALAARLNNAPDNSISPNQPKAPTDLEWDPNHGRQLDNLQHHEETLNLSKNYPALSNLEERHLDEKTGPKAAWQADKRSRYYDCDLRRVTFQMLREYLDTGKLCGSYILRFRFGIGK